MIEFDHYREPEYRIDGTRDVIIGRTNIMLNLFHYLNHLAEKPTTVLLRGETGTGKELCARALHRNGDQRKYHNFVTINCAGIPSELLESELFGYVRGAFTGAYRGTAGKFQYANNGTILLDEIGDMSLQLQAKILRVLQEKYITRVGSAEEEAVDVRIIASTNKDLEDEVKKGNFRKDLFYRLDVIPVTVPPLRERRRDIPLIAEYYIRRCNERYGVQLEGLSPGAIEKLKRHGWDGNVRELENIIERIFILRKGGVVERRELRFNSNMPERIPLEKRDGRLENALNVVEGDGEPTPGMIEEDRETTPKKTVRDRVLVER